MKSFCSVLVSLMSSILFLCFFIGNICSANVGDINNSGSIDIKDVIIALQICAGQTQFSEISMDADLNEDGKIGLEEVIFDLQFIAGLRSQFGDAGKPVDYEQTVDQFKQFMGYDTFSELLPASFNWASNGMVTPSKNQANCGSCWAFASVGALESKILIKDGSEYDLSEQQQISCNKEMYGCNGGGMAGLKFWSSQGPMLESCTDYCQCDGNCDDLYHCSKLNYNVKNYYTVDTSDINEIKSSLYSDGPSYFRFDIYSDFSIFWNNGANGQVYKQSNSKKTPWGHAVLIIGWDDTKNAFLCKNSYGENSGPNGDGTFWMAYSGHINNLHFGMANFSISRTPSSTDDRFPVHRFFNSEVKDHFYTISESEKNMLITDILNWKYNYEGIEFYTTKKQQSNNYPVYRFYSPTAKNHMYTISESEKNALLGDPDNWRYEGIEFYAYTEQNDTFPVYRFYSPTVKNHFYTISENEKDNLLNDPDNWRYEGIAFYAYKTNS